MYRKIQLRVSEYEWKKFKELSRQKISTRQAIETLIYCEPCHKTGIITIANKEGEQISLPKNLIKQKH